MITITKCIEIYPIELAALDTLNKLVFLPRKAHVKSSDDQSYFEFGHNISSRIKEISAKIRSKQYSYKPFRHIKRRTKSKVRDIYLSCWSDKIVEGWINRCLMVLLDKWYSNCCFAHRVKFGLDECQARIADSFKNNRFYIKRDIKNYFYTINQQKLFDQLGNLIDKEDYLFKLIVERVSDFGYIGDNGEKFTSSIGIPFGSSLSCSLSNIYLTNVDKTMETLKVGYFRYADDILIIGNDGDKVINAANMFDKAVAQLGLELKPSHTRQVSFEDHDGFEYCNRISHLGLEYHSSGKVRLSVEKQRKIINLFKREIKRNIRAIKKSKDDERLKLVIGMIKDAILDRIRSAAIIDYYLKHVSDELQLKNLDRLVAELVISTTLRKPFRNKDFQLIPYQKLRDLGLPSLLHRSRLLRHSHLKVNFLSKHNILLAQRHDDMIQRRLERINHMRMGKKMRRQRYSEDGITGVPNTF